MLPKERRLRRREQFDQVFKSGRSLNGAGFRILWAPGEGKAAVVVTKSVGSIAYRNTIRRRWREALASMSDLIPADSDVVIVVKPDGTKERGESLRSSLESALRQIGQ